VHCVGLPIPELEVLRAEPGDLPSRPTPTALLGTRFIDGEPMNAATNRLAGFVYSFCGVPICWRRPLFITAIRSPMVIASTWSCVT